MTALLFLLLVLLIIVVVSIAIVIIIFIIINIAIIITIIIRRVATQSAGLARWRDLPQAAGYKGRVACSTIRAPALAYQYPPIHSLICSNFPMLRMMNKVDATACACVRSLVGGPHRTTCYHHHKQLMLDARAVAPQRKRMSGLAGCVHGVR